MAASILREAIANDIRELSAVDGAEMEMQNPGEVVGAVRAQVIAVSHVSGYITQVLRVHMW